MTLLGQVPASVLGGRLDEKGDEMVRSDPEFRLIYASPDRPSHALCDKVLATEAIIEPGRLGSTATFPGEIARSAEDFYQFVSKNPHG